jgi:hypothetical protein
MAAVTRQLQTAVVNISASNNAVVAAQSINVNNGQGAVSTAARIFVTSYKLQASAASITALFSDQGAALEGAVTVPSSGVLAESAGTDEGYLLKTSLGNSLGITMTGSGSLTGRITYFVAF